MDILVIVSESPWGSTLATTASRFVRATLESGHKVPAVFFRDDGVYNALSGRLSDDGLPSPAQSWLTLEREFPTRMLLCSAASARRFPPSFAENLPGGFREVGLVEMWSLAADCDRVVSF